MNKLAGMLRTCKRVFGQRLRRLLYRNTVAALVATGVDFAVFNTLSAGRDGGLLSPPFATAAGCVVGALVNFSINRVWTFSSHDSTLPQLGRYALVSAAGAGLNAAGVALFLRYVPWDGRIIWCVVRVVVAWGWNLPLQRFFVFARRGRGKPRHTAG